MKHTCAGCDVEIRPGEKVIQMLHGPWFGAITPAYTKLFAEWHDKDKCYREFALNPQRVPYRCEECGREIRLRDTISFLVKGDETDEYSLVAERRGYEIFTVKHHPACPLKS
jgi:predicted RNA-binding Zn-ribbon protein involved in translation (DUF1610 family)